MDPNEKIILSESLLENAYRCRSSGDYAESVRCFEESADLENAIALYELGMAYAQGGLGLAHDEGLAAWRLVQSADLDCMRAVVDLLQWTNWEGDARVQEWEQVVMEKGDDYVKGNCYQAGFGVAEDRPLALVHFTKAANAGDAHAQERLGMLLQSQRDYLAALEWYKKADVHGLAIAQYRIGYIYFKGKGVPKNEFLALPFLRKAMLQGVAAARRRVARSYFNLENDFVDWARGAGALMLSRVPSTKDLSAFGARLGYDWKSKVDAAHTLDVLHKHRLAELYQYGRARHLDLKKWEKLVFHPPEILEECDRIYATSVERARKTSIMVLALRKKRRGTLWALLPRDMINIVSRMIFASRFDPYLLGVRLDEEEQEEEELSKKKMKKGAGDDVDDQEDIEASSKRRRKCKHKCKHKATCGHKCCKI